MMQFLSSLHRQAKPLGRKTPDLSEAADISGLNPVAKPRQRFPAGVGWTLIAVARLGVPVLAAARAKSLAVRLAQGSDRQGQKHLLAQHIFKQKTVFLIITDFGFRCRNGAFGSVGVGFNRAENKVIVAGERDIDGLDAPGAGELKFAGILAAETDVGDDVFGAAVFVNDFGAAGGGE